MNCFSRQVRLRIIVVCLPIIGSLLSTCSAQQQAWVKDMFKVTQHDFGSVPRGAKAVYEFEFTNLYEELVEVAEVRSSCGCTLPSFKKQPLKTYEKGAIVCEFNTRSFIGPKSATVTVVFNRPFRGEVQLRVDGNIRSDIVTEPGEIQFGEVPKGTEKRTKVQVSYAGSNQWEIRDVRSANTNLGVSLSQPRRNGVGRLEYVMNVRLKDSAPAGEFSDQIVLVTNDRQYNLVTIPVRGKIRPPLELPSSVVMGTLKAGQKHSDRVVVTAKEPFEVTKVECNDPRFEFKPIAGKKTGHIIPFSFTAGKQVAAFQAKVTVHTTLSEENTASTFITGNIVSDK